VLEFLSLDNSSSKSILNVLEKIYLIFWKTIVHRVTVVKLGVYDRGGQLFWRCEGQGRDGYSEEHGCDGSRI